MKKLVVLLAALISLHVRAEEVPGYLELARNLVNDVTPEHNEYRHDGWIRVKGDKTLFGEASASEVKTDCSGLVDALFEHTESRFLNAFNFRTWKNYPKAENYYEEIHAGHGFEARKTISDVKVGDIFAARYLSGTDTGHVMLIDAEPKRIEQPLPPVIPDTQQWEVVIIDSSSPHWKGDTRYKENGKQQTGIGRGAIRIYTNATGELVGWAWSMGPASKYRDKDLLAIGKPVLQP